MVDKKAMAKSTKYKVTMAVIRLNGLPPSVHEQETVAIAVRWQGERYGLFPFIRGRKKGVSKSIAKRVECGGSVDWEREKGAAFLDNISVYVSDSGFGRETVDSSPDATFSVLLGYQGQGESNVNKFEVIGTATVSLAEWARGYQSSNKEMNEVTIKESILEKQIKQVPVALRKGSITDNAILDVELWVVEVPTTKGSKVTPSNPDEQSTVSTTIMHRQSTSCTEFVGPNELLDSKNNWTSSHRRRSVGASTSYELGLFCKPSFFSRKSSKNLDVNKNNMVGGDGKHSKKLKVLDEDPIGNWEKLEFTCREAQTKLKSEVFFASIDQRDTRACGESACTALVVVFAHALLSKTLKRPTKQKFDMLIMEGCSEWRKLCDDATLIDCFTDKHFDLETVMSAEVRPIMVLDEKSFIGFFQPESFNSLSGAKSFDEIWNEITSNVQEGETRVYIVSWNDHFFVLKIEFDAYYLLDTLGERLFEGCKKAYMLKFDESSEMYKLPDKSGKGKEEELIVRGKECCREFINRFLAAIPLREELEIEKKGPEAATVGAPHQRLQIEFHFTILSEQLSPSLDTEVGLLDANCKTVNLPGQIDANCNTVNLQYGELQY